MFFRKKKKKPETPKELWAALTEAIESNETKRFEALCQEQTEQILAAFPSWQKPAGGFEPGDTEGVHAYMQVLGHVAQYFAQVLGHPELWQALTGGADNPFARWDAARAKIAQRIEALDYDGAIEQSRELLIDVCACTGDAADRVEEQVTGQLGQLLLHNGETDEALVELEWTLDACRELGDAEGVGIYLGALHDAERYAGRPSRWRGPLADHLEERGDRLGAEWLRRVGSRYPDGEPLLRMVLLNGDLYRELDEELPGDRMQVVFERSKPTLAPTRRWLDRGRQRAESGDSEAALACYIAAADADPHDPESRYQQAYSLMLANQPREALPLYEEIERVAPGWFHSRTWRSLAQRQLDEELPHEVVKLVDLLQDGGLTAKQRLEATQKPILRWPRVPELYFYRGQALAELGRDDAASAWLAGLEVSERLPAIRSRILLELGRFEEVVALEGGNLMAQAAAAIQLRLQG